MSKLVFRVEADYERVIKLREEIAKLKQELVSFNTNKSADKVKVLEERLGTATGEFNKLISEAGKAGAIMDHDFKKKIYDSSQAVNDLTQKIIAQKAVVKDTEADVKRLGESYRIALKNKPLSANSKLGEYNAARRALDEEKAALFGLTQEQSNARLSVKKLRDEYALYNKDAGDVAGANDMLRSSLARFLAEFGGVIAIKKFASQVFDATGKMQQLGVALSTILQSKAKADELVSKITEFAAKTPFNLDDVAQGAKQLLAYGSSADRVVGELSMLGDVASGLQIPIGQLIYLFGTLRTQGKVMTIDIRQFAGRGIPIYEELAKVLGVSKDQVSELVTAGKVGFAEVEKAFQNMTSEGGKFADLMKNSAGIWPQRLSNIGDTLFQKLNDFGNKYKEVFEFGIGSAEDLVARIDEIISVVGGLVAAYGAYKAVLVTTAALQKASVFIENVRLIGTMRKELGLATAAQQAFNVASKANIYAAMFSVFIGLGTAIYMFTKRTKEASAAQQALSKMNKNANEEFSKQAATIDRLSGILKNEKTSIDQKKKALSELQSIVPAYNASLNEEGELINNNTEAIKTYLTQLEKQIKLKAAQEELEELYRKKRLQEKQQKTASEDYTKAQSVYNSSVAMTNSALQNRGINTGVAVFAQSSAVNNTLKDNAKRAKKELNEVNQELNDTLDSISAIEKEIEQSSVSSGGDPVKIQNKSYWEKKKTEAETARDALGVEKQNSKEWNEYTKQIQEAQAQIDKYSTKSTSSKDNSISDQARKIADLEKKQVKERARQAEDLADQVTQSTIDAETDGFKKIQMQRDLDNKKEIQAIERQKEDYINSIIKAEEQKFDTEEDLKAKKDKNYKKKIFDPSSVIVDTSNFDKIEENTRKKQVQLALDIQEKAWNEYLREFGSYQEKRKAIVKLANDEIAKSETDGEKESIRKRTQDQLDELDNSVKNSATLMGQLFADASQKSVTEIQKIIEKAELLMQYLGAVKDEQGDARIGGKTVSKKDILGLGISDNTLKNLEMSADEVEALRNAIEKLKGDLGERSPFKLFKSQVASAVTKIKKGGKDNIAQGITEIGDSITSFTPSISEFGQNLGNIFGNDELGNKIAGVSEAIGGLGETAMGVGQIMAGDIVGGVMSAVSGISSTITSFKKIFGGKSKSERDSERLSKVTNKIAETNEIINKLIEKRIDLIKKATAAERAGLTQTTQDAIDIQKKRIEQEFQKLQGNEILGKKGKNNDLDVKDLGLNSVEDLEKFLSGESMWTPKKGYTSLLELESQGYGLTDKDKWYNLVEEWGKLNDQAEQLKETASEINTGITFDEARDSLDDLLLSADTTFEDIAGNFEGYMRQSILKMVKSEYLNKEMEKWYKQFDERTGDGELSKDDVDKLQKQYENAYSTAQDKVNQMLAAAGLSLESSAQEQSATSRGVETITQDQAGEMNGRITDVQGTTRDIKDQNTQQTQSLNLLTMRADDILRVNSDVRNIADETRSLIANSYLELVQISENTGAIVKPIKEMNDKLDKIQKNTENL